MNFLTSFLGRRLRAASLGRLPWLIGAIGLFLGVSRAMDLWSICWPIGLQGLHGAASESLSIVSAMALWPLIPKMLRTASTSERPLPLARWPEHLGVLQSPGPAR